jgi:hypothetical protein
LDIELEKINEEFSLPYSLFTGKILRSQEVIVTRAQETSVTRQNPFKIQHFSHLLLFSTLSMFFFSSLFHIFSLLVSIMKNTRLIQEPEKKQKLKEEDDGNGKCLDDLSEEIV